MIPATSFLLDGDMALVVEDRNPWLRDLILNSPCDTCGGRGWHCEVRSGMSGEFNCLDCDGTGRHTFDIKVGRVIEGMGEAYRFFRVHVIDVNGLIHNNDAPILDGAHFTEMWDDLRAVTWHDGKTDGVFTLPPDAAPGKWLVRLAVHQ